ICFFFFFQAEDGIRDRNVTGVQTCALPISGMTSSSSNNQAGVAATPCSWAALIDATTASAPAPRSTSPRISDAEAPASVTRWSKIGRASCRERVWREEGAGGVEEKESSGRW